MTDQPLLTASESIEAFEIIQKGIRSAFYTQLFEMLAQDDAEPTTCIEAMLLARERATYGRTASKPSSAGSSAPPPTA